jgi:hypothetical protein
MGIAQADTVRGDVPRRIYLGKECANAVKIRTPQNMKYTVAVAFAYAAAGGSLRTS